MQTEEVSEMIEDYFSRLVPVVFKHQGMIDKFVGDAIFTVFGSHEADEKQHPHAIQAALEMQSVMQEVNVERCPRGKPEGEKTPSRVFIETEQEKKQ
jgi:adenylate cyclase